VSKINDEEDLLKAIKVYVEANLNTRIAAINTEKGDFDIDTISDYVYAGELQDIPNHPFVNFAIDGDIEVKSNRGDMASIPVIRVEVAFDNPKKENTYFKSLRYMRAVYETILGFESSAIEADDLQITKAIPMVVTTMTGRQLVVSGASLSVALG
jgi:hypothetical protein